MGNVMDWNPRYVCYAKANGRTPEAQREHDRREWPGAAACPIILWLRRREQDSAKAHPEAVTRGGGISDHDAYTRFLEDWADRVHVVRCAPPEPQLHFEFAA
jgi:hypothetical protein